MGIDSRRRKAQLASTSVPMLSGMEKLVANAARGAGTRAGAGGSVAAVPGSSGGGTGETATKLFKMLGFGNTKQEETNEFTHMRYELVPKHDRPMYVMYEV